MLEVVVEGLSLRGRDYVCFYLLFRVYVVRRVGYIRLRCGRKEGWSGEGGREGYFGKLWYIFYWRFFKDYENYLGFGMLNCRIEDVGCKLV